MTSVVAAGRKRLLDLLHRCRFPRECRTFGPGEYPSLPGMNNAISSGRRISNDYPYRDRPDWNR